MSGRKRFQLNLQERIRIELDLRKNRETMRLKIDFLDNQVNRERAGAQLDVMKTVMERNEAILAQGKYVTNENEAREARTLRATFDRALTAFEEYIEAFHQQMRREGDLIRQRKEEIRSRIRVFRSANLMKLEPQIRKLELDLLKADTDEALSAVDDGLRALMDEAASQRAQEAGRRVMVEHFREALEESGYQKIEEKKEGDDLILEARGGDFGKTVFRFPLEKEELKTVSADFTAAEDSCSHPAQRICDNLEKHGIRSLVEYTTKWGKRVLSASSGEHQSSVARRKKRTISTHRTQKTKGV